MRMKPLRLGGHSRFGENLRSERGTGRGETVVRRLTPSWGKKRAFGGCRFGDQFLTPSEKEGGVFTCQGSQVLEDQSTTEVVPKATSHMWPGNGMQIDGNSLREIRKTLGKTPENRDSSGRRQ